MKTDQIPSATSQATQRAMMEVLEFSQALNKTYEAASVEKPKRYQVINTRTGKVYGPYANITTARTARERKDNAYGGYAHTVREIV